MRQAFLPSRWLAQLVISVRVWTWGFLMDLAHLVAPYPAVVVLEDEDTWGNGYVWLITTNEYERICRNDGCQDVIKDAWERVYEL